MTVTVETNTGTITAPDQEAADEFIAHMKHGEELREAKRERWGTDNLEQMRRLCAGFPSLRGLFDAPLSFDVDRLLTWLLTSGAVTSGSSHAAKFVLQVWNSRTDWREYAVETGLLTKRSKAYKAFTPFNVAAAFGCWDYAHCAAFLAWVELPFFP